MLQSLNLPDWLPWWIPLALLVPGLLWALSFLFMPFSVFGVKSRLEIIEARLEEIQHEIRHVALRLPPGGLPAPDYDDVFPPRMEPRIADRVTTRPPIPPARHEILTTQTQGPPPEPALEDRPPPAPNARPVRRNNEPLARPDRAEPRLDWRR
ncbi:MAG: hypothetical protein ABSA58_22260 [Acetobacteraceae bacterium]|jgi:hypothetical protein